jgi:lysophospholipase L1-like esterase
MPKDTTSTSSTFKSLVRQLFGTRKVEMKKKLPQIVLFGDSLTEWAFDETTAGFGWVLEEKYHGKAEIVNEGIDHTVSLSSESAY